MFRKLILTTVCGLIAFTPQGNCDSRRAPARTNAEEAFSDVAQARKELSNMLVGKTQLTSKELTAAITKAEQCVELCEDKMKQQDRRTARKCEIPDIQDQGSFLKEVLESISRVQTATRSILVAEKEKLDKLFSNAIRCYKGEIGPLVETAQRTLAQRLAQVDQGKAKVVTRRISSGRPKVKVREE